MVDAKLIAGETVAPKFAPFNVVHVEYKRVNDVPISASILIPKELKAGKYPVTVHWHGGGLGTGERLFADWYGDWTLQLALKHTAITIAPDYRLLPEASGLDILQDLRDFYTWLLSPGTLTSRLPPGLTPDLSALLITGESAGGYLTLQTHLQLPNLPIAAMISHYPMIDMRSPHFKDKYHKDLLTPPLPQFDPAILAAHIASLKGGEIVTSRHGPTGDVLLMSLVQQGEYIRYFGTDVSLYPLETLGNVESSPPLWILHGEKDSVVPVEGTRKFEKAIKDKFPETPLLLTYREGEEHGFDLHDAESGSAATLETAWVKEGLGFVEKYWPRNE